MLADDTDGCYNLFPIQLQYFDIIMHFALYNVRHKS
jgi:hypothetical protein